MTWCLGVFIVGMLNSIVVTMLVSVAAFAQSVPEYTPTGSVRNYFLGAWKLVSTENKYPDGHTTYDYGPDAIGFLMYTASGHMCAQLMKRGRQRWVDDNTPNASEAADAFGGFFLLRNFRVTRGRAHYGPSP